MIRKFAFSCLLAFALYHWLIFMLQPKGPVHQAFVVLMKDENQEQLNELGDAIDIVNPIPELFEWEPDEDIFNGVGNESETNILTGEWGFTQRNQRTTEADGVVAYSDAGSQAIEQALSPETPRANRATIEPMGNTPTEGSSEERSRTGRQRTSSESRPSASPTNSTQQGNSSGRTEASRESEARRTTSF